MKRDPTNDARDLALMERIAQGDTKAFKRLFDGWGRELTRLAYSYTHSHDLAEDVVQDVFVTLWEKRDTLEIREVMPYLVRLTRNRALNMIRDRTRAEHREHTVAQDQETIAPVAINLGVESSESDEVVAALRTALAELPSRQREVFLLHREQDLDYVTIATALDISVPSARNLMSKAVHRLAEHLAKLI